MDDVKYIRPDGSQGILGLKANTIASEPGTFSGFLLMGTDITDRRMIESQLAQSQKLEAMGQLAAGIAHEINTPTQYVGDNIGFLREAFGDIQSLLDLLAETDEQGTGAESLPERIARIRQLWAEIDVSFLLTEVPAAIDQAQEGVVRVTNIVRAMKEFSHPDTGEKQMADLNKAIESTMTVCRNEWKYVAELVSDLDPDLPLVPCMVGDINQVILNMIVNAAHAIEDLLGRTPEVKGQIRVSTAVVDGLAEVRIADTGCGIAEESQSRVFDLFYTTKDVGRGTGQGLALARAVIVERHGGTITFESTPGEGTTFIIRLPLEDSESAGPAGRERAHEQIA
jgi:signal transduction histidine kinase